MQPSPTSTGGLSGITVSDPTDSIGGQSKESKCSTMGRRRDGSPASSRQSQTDAAATSSNTARAGAGHSRLPVAQQPKKSRSLLAFLCCGGRDDTSKDDSERAPIPLKKLPNAAVQTAPVTASKPETNAVTGVKKEADTPSVVKELGQSSTGVPSNAAQSEGAMDADNATDGVAHVASETRGSSNDLRNQPLPPTPQNDGRQLHDDTVSSHPVIAVQQPATIAAEPEDTEMSGTATSIEENDADGDVPMPDAPSPPVEHAKPTSTGDNEMNNGITAVPPPPPPPPIVPEPIRSGPSLSQTAGSTTATEQTKWLLPPIEPRFKGRKCLVLDLDETLVHSSFKVISTPVWSTGQAY